MEVEADGLVVGIQNGMTMDDMASIFGPQRTLGAVIETASNMFEPGIVNRQTPRGATWFGLGAYDESTRSRKFFATPARWKFQRTSGPRSG